MYSKSCSSVRANTEAESVAEAGGVSSAVAVDAVDGLLYIATGAIIAPAPTDSGTDAVAQSTSEGDEGGDQEEVPILCVRVWRCVPYIHAVARWRFCLGGILLQSLVTIQLVDLLFIRLSN